MLYEHSTAQHSTAQHSTAQQRSITLDLIKGLAVIFVVWGHFIQSNYVGTDAYFDNIVFKIIYSFHMPLFALISGYLFYGSVKKRNVRILITTRVTGLLLPLVIWCSLNWLLSAVLHRQISLTDWWNNITGNFLWFIWSILAAQLVLGIVEKVLPQNICWIAYLVGAAVVWLFPNHDLNLYLYPYVLLGFIWKKQRKDTAWIERIKWLAIPVWILMLLFYGRDSYIYTTGIVGADFGTIVFRYVIGFAGSLSVIVGVMACEEELKRFIFLPSWGRNSLQVYIV